MFPNLFALVVVFILAIFFAWLTYRAIRAKRLWVKLVGGLAAGLVTLLLVGIAFAGTQGFMEGYFPGVPDAPDLTVAGTPEQIARGEYLVNIACIGCHGAVSADGGPTGELPLSGGWNIAEYDGFGFMGSMVTENLTPGGKLAGYTDGELFRVLRHSVDQNGHMLGFMDFLPYKELSDADTEAIIAYLRSLEPVANSVETGDKINFISLVIIGSGMFQPSMPGAETVTAPPEGVTAEYGQYVATYGECRGCHGPEMTSTEATSMTPSIPNPRPLVITLTQEQFFEMMRTGIRPDNSPFPETMPWRNAAAMNDDDLAALYLYLTTEP